MKLLYFKRFFLIALLLFTPKIVNEVNAADITEEWIDGVLYLYYDDKSGDFDGDSTAIVVDCNLEFPSNITIPERTKVGNCLIISINSWAFQYCDLLSKITLPESIKSIGAYAFYRCDGLKQINIPNNVNRIGEGAFKFCSSIQEITLPENITTIEDETFYECVNLQELTIPKNVKYIGSGAFSGCLDLKYINIFATEPPIIYDSTFDKTDITVYVPDESVEKYKNSDGWNKLNIKSLAKIDFITLNQNDIRLTKKTTIQLIATALPEYADDRSVVWSSDNVNIATVDENGLVTAIGMGETIITATAHDGSGRKAQCNVTVTPKLAEQITLNAEEITLYRDCTKQLTATIYPEDADIKDVTWSSSNEWAVTVDENGLVTCLDYSYGEAVITATANDGSGVIATCKVTLKQRQITSLSLSADELSLERTSTALLTSHIIPDNADRPALIWRSSDENVATVNYPGVFSTEGFVTAVGVGEAVITAYTTDGSGITATCKVIVTPKLVTSVTLDQSELTIERTYTAQLSATIAPEDADNRNVTWTSDNEEVATVDENGLVTAVGVGEANITATAADGSGVTATCKVTVTPKLVTSVTLDQSELTIEKTYTAQLSATVAPDDADNRTVTWTSDNEEIATVDENGLVTAVGEGTATITATANDGSGVAASCVVTVTFIDGIADIETSKVTVLAANGRITVSGKEKDDTVSVYDTGGRLLYRGESDVIDVPRKAMYIVTVSGKNYKVIVP